LPILNHSQIKDKLMDNRKKIAVIAGPAISPALARAELLLSEMGHEVIVVDGADEEVKKKEAPKLAEISKFPAEKQKGYDHAGPHEYRECGGVWRCRWCERPLKG
jgi:hypothetical protein